MPVRDPDELADVPDPAWPEIERLLAEAATPARVLQADAGRGRRVLHALQVTARSYLGALALHTGGILADSGWFRLLGAGAKGLPDLAQANGLGAPTEDAAQPGLLLVGVDAVGGRFAINGGDLTSRLGEVCYFGPDTLSWDGLGVRHADFVRGVLDGSLAQAFASLRWQGWQAEVAPLAPDQGLSLYPPPFTAEGSRPASVSRRIAPLSELHSFYDEAARQLRAR